MKIRLYTPKDKEALIKLLRLNTPRYFAPSEEEGYLQYLDHHSENYFLIEEDNAILGAGGFNLLEGKNVARISWDLVHPDHQAKGLGSRLTRYRITKINGYPEVEIIEVRTSQMVYTFYEKLGFMLKEVLKDYWAEGFDLYRMEYRQSSMR